MNKYKEFFNKTQNMVSTGLIAISLIIIQSFISIDKFDIFILISVLAFSIAIPMLVFNILLSELFDTSKDLKPTKSYRFIWFTSIFSSIVAIVAAFWHMQPLAGLTFMLSGVIGLVIFINNDTRIKDYLMRDEQINSQKKVLKPDEEE